MRRSSYYRKYIAAILGVCSISAVCLYYVAMARPAVPNAKKFPVRAVALPAAESTYADKPAIIAVPALNIKKQLEDGVYDPASHTWNLSNTNAHYATMSAPANLKGGNTLVYGHNSRSIFGKLPNLPLGGGATIETEHGLRFHYQLESVVEVQPEDVAILDHHGMPILTIQTCSGNWNEKRQMFRFTLLRLEIPPHYSRSNR